MCVFCGFDPQHKVEDGAANFDWNVHAMERILAAGVVVEDAAALFGGAVPKTFEPPASPEADETGFSPFFDIPSGPSTNVFLNVGFRINAEISVAGDTDWFAMSLVQGQTYQISLKALPFFGLGDPELYLFDNFGNFLTFDDNSGSGLDSVLTVTATRTGTYYAGATGFGADAQTTGFYEISLVQVNLTADTVGETPETAASLAMGSTVAGTIDTIGDEDWYAVSLEAGRTYSIFLEARSASFTPLQDPALEVLGPQLQLVGGNDDDGITKNAYFSFTATQTDTYYVKALGSAGNTGDFNLTIVDFTPPPPPDPTDGLDWGVQFDKTHIKVYFAAQGETFFGETTDTPWTEYEIDQAMAALGEFSKFTLLTFEVVANQGQSDFVLTKNFLDSNNTGRMAPPDPEFGEDQGVGWFNTNPLYWSDKAGGLLEKGSYGYSNFMHEFGHGLGLAHPHDDGGTSAVFDGVAGSGDLGTLSLNQEVFTIMSYNKGWQTGPDGSSGTNSYGIARTPMAFDIALLQEKYGVNESHAKGKNTYTLFTQNKTGTGYEAIWDTGGVDQIRAKGSADATIDLRAASLDVAKGGGGFVSFIDGIFGGFTIANGVKIENAKGAGGNDLLVGNKYANRLDGGAGGDTMRGLGGNDTYVVDRAGDKIAEFKGGGRDEVQSAKISLKLASYANVEDARLTGKKNLDLTGSAAGNRLEGNSGKNVLKGAAGADTLGGGKGKDVLVGGGGKDRFVFEKGDKKDVIRDFAEGLDRIDLTDFGLSGFKAVKKLFADTGRDMEIRLNKKDILVLEDIQPNDLSKDDFLV